MASAIRLIVVFALLNLTWEVLQLPFYTIWTTGTQGGIAYAVIHCTGGDVLIGAAAALVSWTVLGTGLLQARGAWRFLMIFIPLALAYTMFSEWLNVVVIRSWTYSDLMPRVPPLGTGLTPLLQWIIVPLATWATADQATRARLSRQPGMGQGASP